MGKEKKQTPYLSLSADNFIPKKSASNLSVNLKNYLRFPV